MAFKRGVYLLVVPVVQCALCHLEVRTGDALGQLCEQGDHHLLKLCRLYHIQDLLQLIEKHNLQIEQHIYSFFPDYF